jgi:hypothetical protein
MTICTIIVARTKIIRVSSAFNQSDAQNHEDFWKEKDDTFYNKNEQNEVLKTSDYDSRDPNQSFHRRNTFSEVELAKKREWIQKMKKSLQNSKHEYFKRGDQGNNKMISNTSIKKKKKFKTQEISRKIRSTASETSPEQRRINLTHKTGSYYQRLRKSNIESEQQVQDNKEYQQHNDDKYSKIRISRSTLVNKPAHDGPAQGTANMSSSQNIIHKHPDGEYSQNVKFDYNAINKAKQTLRDFSTGAESRYNDNSLTTSKGTITAQNM